jgi:hypothetical protein
MSVGGQNEEAASVGGPSVDRLAEFLDNLALVVGVFFSDLPGLVGARRLVFRFVLGCLLLLHNLVTGGRPPDFCPPGYNRMLTRTLPPKETGQAAYA